MLSRRFGLVARKLFVGAPSASVAVPSSSLLSSSSSSSSSLRSFPSSQPLQQQPQRHAHAAVSSDPWQIQPPPKVTPHYPNDPDQKKRHIQALRAPEQNAEWLAAPDDVREFWREDGSVIPCEFFKAVKHADAPRGATVVVLSDLAGVNDQVRVQAQRIADEGFDVFVPHLSRGREAELKALYEEGKAAPNDFWMSGLRDIEGISAFLKKHNHKDPWPTARGVATVGFGFGGALSMAAATTTLVDAAVSFDGVPPFLNLEGGLPLFSAKDLARLNTPIQLHYGQPIGSGEEDLKRFRDALENVWFDKCNYFPYSDVSTGFMNNLRWATERRQKLGLLPYKEEAAARAWARVIHFLLYNIPPQEPPFRANFQSKQDSW